MFNGRFWLTILIACLITFGWGCVEGAFYKAGPLDCPAFGESIISFGPNKEGVGFSEAVISHFPQSTQQFVYDNFRIPVPVGFERYSGSLEHAEKGLDVTIGQDLSRTAGEAEHLPGLARKAIKFAIAILPMYYSANLGFNLVHGMRCHSA